MDRIGVLDERSEGARSTAHACRLVLGGQGCGLATHMPTMYMEMGTLAFAACFWYRAAWVVLEAMIRMTWPWSEKRVYTT